ncbi:hypothetical protein [Paenisporosarcina sp. NPDC076898]|uniref:hypothetical protein n=1 Tax=unclassified Paenisporosarcina TaxID=2642018 RepID=UPI003D09099E
MINFYGMEQMMEAKKMEMARYNEDRFAYQQFKKNKARMNVIEMFKKTFSKRSVNEQIECCAAN